MCSDRDEDVVEKQLARLVGVSEGRQHGLGKTGKGRIIDTHGLIDQIANSRRVRVVCDRIQRGTL
jgi:hypothetical protein